MRGPAVLVATALAGILAFVVLFRFGSQASPEPQAAPPVEAAPAASAAPAPVATAALDPSTPLPVVKVYKSPSCGCCGDWVEHMREHGFQVEVVDTDQLATVKAALGIPAAMGSCHTAEIGDILVEGHVPAGDVKALLAEGSGARGLAVPGMPVGSPGMEIEGQPAQPYDVVAFGEDGSTRVYRSYR